MSNNSQTPSPTPNIISNSVQQISQPPPTNAPNSSGGLHSLLGTEAPQSAVFKTNVSNTTTNITNNATIGFQSVFTKSNIVMLFSFTLLYLLIYGIMYFMLGGNIATTMNSWFIDCFAVMVFIFFVMYYYFSSTETQVENFFGDFFVGLRDFLDKPSSFFTIILFLMLKYMLFYILQIPMDSNKPYSVILFEIIVWGLFIFDIFGLVFKYIFGFSIVDLILNPLIEIWNILPNNLNRPVDISGGYVNGWKNEHKNYHYQVISMDSSGTKITTPPSRSKSEVYNVSNNLYTYEEAQSICQNYSARLATYDDIENSYNDGGEWCNYGWSDGQMALFPTQKDTWNRLQHTKTHKNDCGRPGINGGYIDNPYIKFGVNCYGVKPTPGPNDLSNNTISTAEEIVQSSVDKELLKNVAINSFNSKKWSEF